MLALALKSTSSITFYSTANPQEFPSCFLVIWHRLIATLSITRISSFLEIPMFPNMILLTGFSVREASLCLWSGPPPCLSSSFSRLYPRTSSVICTLPSPQFHTSHPDQHSLTISLAHSFWCLNSATFEGFLTHWSCHLPFSLTFLTPPLPVLLRLNSPIIHRNHSFLCTLYHATPIQLNLAMAQPVATLSGLAFTSLSLTGALSAVQQPF